MRIATWNVNSVRQRLDHVLGYLGRVEPDVLCLQELKCTDESFPRAEVEAAGYRCYVHGQKGFNGVAILTKADAHVETGLPGDEADVQSRYIEARVPDGPTWVRVASIYLPNGNPVASEKYPYKLGFMDRLIQRTRNLLALEETLVLAGDYNVIPEPIDVHNPEAWSGDALFLPTTRERYRTLVNLGLTDAVGGGRGPAPRPPGLCRGGRGRRRPGRQLVRVRPQHLGQRPDRLAGLLRAGVVRQQFGRVGLERGRAARLQPDDRHPGLQPRAQHGQRPGQHLLGLVQLPGAVPGQAAADRGRRDLDPVAQRLQRGHRVPADGGLQVVGERVRPHQQPRPVHRTAGTPAAEPGLE